MASFKLARFSHAPTGRGAAMLWWMGPLALAALVAAVAGLLLSEYLVYVATSWIALGLVALGLDLVWGKGGDLSLGHTVFFGLGAYAYGIAAINLSPLIGGTVYIALVTGIIVGGSAAAGIGYFLFYGRLGPFQTTIITYTLVLVTATLAVGFAFQFGEARVGGANGMTGIPPMSLQFGADAAALSRYGSFLASLAIAAVTYIALSVLLRQPFGLVISGIRQNILKTELLGYDVRFYRVVLFAISGAIAGVGGAIYASWALYISPSAFSIMQALLIPIYVLVGGLGTLAGAFVGAIFIGGLSFWLGGGVVGGQTSLVLGAGLILLVLFAPGGLLGLSNSLWRRRYLRDDDGLPASEESQLQELEGLFQRKPSGKILLETVMLKKRFGGVTATDDVSLQFPDCGIHCLIGPNGAGKSTFLTTCLGLLKADGGRVIFEGQDITRWEPYLRVQRGLGIKLQVARILESLSARENLWLSAYGALRDKAKADERVIQVLKVIGLSSRAEVPGGALSHGEQQWLDLGMVLCLEPKLIFLDEPAAGMTAKERGRMVVMLKHISRFAGVVVVEHDMDFVRDLDAPVTVLHQGAVFASGTIAELRKDERVLDIYLGRPKVA